MELLYFQGNNGNPRLCVPTALQSQILDEAHNLPTEGAHRGFACIFNRVRETYYWPKMDRSINQYVHTCDLCLKNKPRRHGQQGFLQPIPIPDQPFEVVTLDFIMDLPESKGFNAILVIVDKLMRYAHFLPCTTHIDEVETACLFASNIWSHYGLPRQIISSRDSRWTGAFWDHLTSFLGIKRSLTTACHPQADGQTKIMNQTLEIMLRSYVDSSKSNWCTLLPTLAFSYNTSRHSTTTFTPSYLLRGFEPLCPLNLLSNLCSHIPHIESETAEQFFEEMNTTHNIAKDAICLAQIHQQKSYNSGRHFAQFQPGDKVFINLKMLELLNSYTGKGRKLNQLYDGPFEVMEQISPVTY
jgi:hypothetical protein